MSDNNGTVRHEAPTRREYVKYGGAVVGGGLLAGCIGGADQGSTPSESDTPSEPTEDESYSVTMSPVGEVTFDEVPTRWYGGGNSDWIDMAIALGQLDGWLPSMFRNALYFQDLGVDVIGQHPPSEWREEGDEDKEVFYDLNPDVLLIDRVNLEVRDKGWSTEDTEEIEQNVAPFFGATVHRYRRELDYEPPLLYDAFGKLAEVFKQEARYQALAEIHGEVLGAVKDGLPPEDERPSVGYLNNGNLPQEGEFYVIVFDEYGAEHKQYRDLEIDNAFAEMDIEDETTDYEGLLEADPDVLVIQDMLSLGSEFVSQESGSLTFDGDLFREKRIEPMSNDAVGQQLTAVQEGRVYPGGVGEQGPVTNLYNTEMLARQLYPETFGAFDPDAPLDVAAEDQLFDRQRVADIINGDF